MKCRNVVNGQLVWFGKATAPTNVRYELDVKIPSHTVEIPIEEITVPAYNAVISMASIPEDGYVVHYYHQDPSDPESPIIEYCVLKWDVYGKTATIYGEDIVIEPSYTNPIGVAEFITYKSGGTVAVNYVSDTDAVVSSLTQRLSVIKGELWYQCNFGLPLTEKYKSKAIFDASVLSIITNHPGVKSVNSFTSKIEEHTYAIDIVIETIFGDTVSLSNSTNI